MAIFKKTKKTSDVATVSTSSALSTNALVRPHISEKAAILAEKGTYVFEVAKNTNKIEVAKAIESLYKVKPVRVNIVNLPDTKVFVRGRNGVKAGVRKALVTLKSGDKIEIV